MAEGGNKVGEVYVEIKATGGDSIAKEVQRGQAQAAAIAPNGFTQLPAWAGSAGASSTMTMGGGASAVKETTSAVREQAAVISGPLKEAVEKADDADKKFAESKKTLRQEVVSLRQNILGTVGIIGSFGAAVAAVVSNFIEARNAGASLSSELKNLEAAGKIKLDFGLPQMEETLKSARAEIQRSRDAVNEANTGTEAFGQRMIASLLDARNAGDLSLTAFSALKAMYKEADGTFEDTLQTKIANLELDNEDLNVVNRIIAAEKNRADLAREQASYKESTKYLGEFNKEADATIEAQRKAELAELEGAARIRKQRDFDIDDLQKRKSNTEDAGIRELIDMQIEAREKIAAADIRIANKTQDEKDKIARDAAERRVEAAQREQAAIIKIADEARSAILNGIGGNQMIQSLRELVEISRTMAQELRRG